ncbi:diguanylate cyclase (GGDEF)-like protein [Marinomonas alcarazii]|uniref:diguanylate cyclase n=1 Tax=Marinomonas alcarazii TaxID=491949 RepID=A0A318V9K0_9GAMM|nr:GGDEF domain-containing protein [Marinomonas alcarazii]PYF80579.1 diguanylate cyclase (GGDEF)-like protein [Marinomonas alcarazii]
MTIKSRFLLSTTGILLLTCFFSWLSIRVLAEDLVESWVERYAEKQARYDKARTLLPLIQEINLSKEFAELDSLKAWAEQPNNESLKQQAFIDAEEFRMRFAEKSYFIALKKNERYYFSDDDASGKFYRYTLESSKESDAWFYQIMEHNLDLHLNVNPDVELGVIKLWSDVLIRQGDEILGVVGTGLDLSDFLDQMVEKQDVYSAIVFTNYEGAIQLYQQKELINYSSLTKNAEGKKLIFQLLDNEESKERLKQALKSAKNRPNKIEMTRVDKDGTHQLASVIYIPEIDWLQVNFIDIGRFLPLSEFSSLFVVFFVSLVVALIIFYVLLSLIVTKPLAELDLSIRQLGKNRYRVPQLSYFAGTEIKRLVSHYEKMSTSLLEYQHQLEEKVKERTAELNRLSILDPLTELYNRRGFEMYMKEYLASWQKDQKSFGLINVDVNEFKLINDRLGHAAGDFVLQKIASYLLSVVDEKGVVARWGGDEFLILVRDKQEQDRISERLRSDKVLHEIDFNGDRVSVQFSIGNAFIQDQDTLESLLHRADKAMYAVKFNRQ